MHPNTGHRVFTLRECVAAGGHFYSLDHLEKTLLGRLREHFWGPTTVNADQDDSDALIVALGRWVLLRLGEQESFNKRSEDDDDEILEGKLTLFEWIWEIHFLCRRRPFK